MALESEEGDADRCQMEVVQRRRKKSRAERGPRSRRRKKKSLDGGPLFPSSSEDALLTTSKLRAEAKVFVLETAPCMGWKQEQKIEGLSRWSCFGETNLLLVSPTETLTESHDDENMASGDVGVVSAAEERLERMEKEAAATLRAASSVQVDTGEWAKLATEAERARRMAELAKLEAEEVRERARRRAWAARAIANEQRRRAAPAFLTATANTLWFEEMVGCVWKEDYVIACPYARLGCGVACRRSALAAHLTGGCVYAPDVIADDSSDTDYVVVCPNAVMGCGVVCRRDELQAHLDACPFSDSSREQERALREHWRTVVAAQAEQERDRRVVADARATLPSAAARAARNRAGITAAADSAAAAKYCPSSSSRQAALLKQQRMAALESLGGEIAELWRRHRAAAAPLAPTRLAALEAVRHAVSSAFAIINASRETENNEEGEKMSVELFGSCAYGLETPDSDLDLVVRSWASQPAPLNNATWVLHRLAQQLRKRTSGASSFRVDRLLDRARVPIIRGAVCVGAIEIKVDLSLETSSHTGLAAAGLCSELMTRLPALAPAAVAIKRLLKASGLNDPYRGGLPSYALVLMLLYSRLHAKHAEQIVKPTCKRRPFERSDTLEDRAWRNARALDLLKQPRNVRHAEQPWLRGRLTAAQLLDAGGLGGSPDDFELATTLIDFLHLFGDDFCPAKDGISLRHGGRRLVIDSGRRFVIAPNLGDEPHCQPLTGIVVEDPLDPRNNVGRASYDIHRALQLFACRHDRLRAAMSRHLDYSDNAPSTTPLLDALFGTSVEALSKSPPNAPENVDAAALEKAGFLPEPPCLQNRPPRQHRAPKLA